MHSIIHIACLLLQFAKDLLADMADEHQSIAIQAVSIANVLAFDKELLPVLCHILQVMHRYKGYEQTMADKNLDG